MVEVIYLFLFSFVVVSLMMFAVWLLQLKNKNAGIVDVAWAFSFMASVVLFSFLTEGNQWRSLLFIFLVSIWCLRLGIHLFIRNWGKPEDVRYAQMRKEWGTQANVKMFLIFEFQALVSAFLSLSFLWVLKNTAPIKVTDLLGFLLMAIGIVGETLADYQLQRFKRKGIKNGICKIGLWNYSRHPNYFFEWMVWLGIATVAWSARYGWLAFYAPLVMWHFLNNVTGIKLTEEHMAKTRGEEYLEYQKSTSAFVPWIKQKSKRNDGKVL